MSIAETAFALLTAHKEGETKLTRRAGGFLGQLVAEPTPLTDKQAEWMATLLERAGMPEMGEMADA